MDILRHRSIAFCLFATLALISLLVFAGEAVDETARYRPLANGWVSRYSEILLNPEMDLREKVSTVVNEDLDHGRFRPLFSLYSTISYSLTPIIEDRLPELNERNYLSLITGDLQVQGWVLLVTMALASAFLGVLVLQGTGSFLAACLPLIFIPLSPALTENLLHNYIDSQEIPLIFLLSGWLFFLVSSLFWRSSGLIGKIEIFMSFLFLFFAMLMKETAIVGVGAIVGLLFFGPWKHDCEPVVYRTMSLIVGTLIFSICCSIGIYLLVTTHRHGYAAAYHVMDVHDLMNAASKLWNCMSQFSLHNLLGWSAIIGSVFILVKKDAGMLPLHGIRRHLGILLMLTAIAYGSLAILLPWKPILIKYSLPSVFFFSYLVAYAVGIIICLLNETRLGKLRLAGFFVMLPFLVMFFTLQGKADYDRRYLFAVANYGIKEILEVAADIDSLLESKKKGNASIYVGFEADRPWDYHITWSTLHVSRLLNLHYNYNIIDKSGKTVLQVRMPEGELTSYKYKQSSKNILLSERFSELALQPFEAVYLGFNKKSHIQDTISFNGKVYRKARLVVDHRNRYGLPSLYFVCYLPLTS